MESVQSRQQAQGSSLEGEDTILVVAVDSKVAEGRRWVGQMVGGLGFHREEDSHKREVD